MSESDWKRILDELQARRAKAREMGGEERVAAVSGGKHAQNDHRQNGQTDHDGRHSLALVGGD